MYKLSQVKSIHFEITTKCQARCPMCPRRVNGGLLNPLIKLEEVSLAQFKSWFSPTFIQQLNHLFMCGNLGDPIIAHDTLEIFKYLRDNNQHMALAMHTNGSARSTNWWRGLAKHKVSVTFGIDGMEDTHHLYRIDTSWSKIIENANAFIQAGGIAEWHMLVFHHNEHQVQECKELSQKLNFNNFTTKHTTRFIENKFHVLDDEGKTINILYPTSASDGMINKAQIAAKDVNPPISCKASNDSQMYVSANGTVTPCCWLDYGWALPNHGPKIDYMDTIGKYHNLNNNSIEEIFNSDYFTSIENTWKNKPLKECSRQCGNFDKLREQFREY